LAAARQGGHDVDKITVSDLFVVAEARSSRQYPGNSLFGNGRAVFRDLLVESLP
jgi:hypothetical protein